ncbi:MAG: alpha-E domain-containing protein [Lautropia sp.]
MLSRVAANLYWMSRYLERAENLARFLDVGQSLALIAGTGPNGDPDAAIEPLVITGTLEPFDAAGLPRTPEAVAAFVAWNRDNASSIFNCFQYGRENARAVRAAITTEMWENVNDTWLQLLAKRHMGNEPADNAFFEWVKERAHLFRGVTLATIRRDQPYQFIRLGTFIERADNTARILSLKRQDESRAGQPARAPLDSITDFYRLSALLRSVSAFESYRDTYSDSVDARRVAELLVLDPTLPRSLRFCLDQIVRLLAKLPSANARAARRLAATAQAELEYASIEEILSRGLDSFLDDFLQRNGQLGDLLRRAYLELE